MSGKFAVGDRVKIIRGETFQDILIQYVGNTGVIHYVHSLFGDITEESNQVVEQSTRKYLVHLRTGENIAFPEDWLEIVEEA